MQTRTSFLLMKIKALGDPIRLRILESLPSTSEGEEACNVSELAGGLSLPQPTVSHHLGILRNAGLVQYKKMQRDVYYWTDTESFEETLDDLKAILHKEGSGPES